MYWAEENSVSVIDGDKVEALGSGDLKVGEDCVVVDGKRRFNGKVAAVGKKTIFIEDL